MKMKAALAVLSLLFFFSAQAFAGVVVRSHSDPSGVTITTTVDTDQRSVRFDFDLTPHSVVPTYGYIQIGIGQPGVPAAAIVITGANIPTSIGRTSFKVIPEFQIQYESTPPPMENYITFHYKAGHNFAGFDSPNNNFQVSLSEPPGGFPPGQEDNATLGAYTPTLTAGNAIPVADPNGPYMGEVGAAVMFDGTGSDDPDGSIVSYDWDFGDGATGNGPQPQHAYAAAGVYDVSLTVTDDAGAASVPALTTATISAANQVPTANPNGPYAGTAGMAVSFDGSLSSDPDGTIVSYDWDFGDGMTGTGVSPTHTYAAAGFYTVGLTVTDNDGATSSSVTTTVAIDAANAASALPAVYTLLLF